MMFGDDDYEQFAIVREVEPRAFVLHVFGDADISSAQRLIAAIDEIVTIDRDSTLQINLTRCRYLDTSGLSALVHAHDVFGARLSIIATVRSHILRVLHLVGFEKMLNIVTELHRYDVTSGRPQVALAAVTP